MLLLGIQEGGSKQCLGLMKNPDSNTIFGGSKKSTRQIKNFMVILVIFDTSLYVAEVVLKDKIVVYDFARKKSG